MGTVINASILALIYVQYICSASAFLSCTVSFDEGSKTLFISDGKKTPYVAQALFSNDINSTGWSYLYVKTNPVYPDELQSKAAGMAEGYISSDLIYMHYANTLRDYCSTEAAFCTKLSTFIEQNNDWLNKNIDANQEDSYWHQVSLIYAQFDGLKMGYNAKKGVQKIDDMGFAMIQLSGDMETLEQVLGKKVLSRVEGSGHCSALVKVFPGMNDIGISQVTWNDYNAMLRVFKLYEINVHQQDRKEENSTSAFVPARNQSFSSYPGTLFSGDDFYMLSSGLVTQETTIGNSNKDLLKYITPNCVFEWVRTMVANRLAKNGNDWVSIFAKETSGTYNNQWMVLDYNVFVPKEPLHEGLLWVLEQIPGAVNMADMTLLLAQQGYWASYNIPYFPYIYNMSGVTAAKAKYGSWFDYTLNPRSQIFRRDHGNVQDMQSFVALMRYNNYQKDPLSTCKCTPPYSAENAISARSDLNPKNGTYPFGALGHRRHGGTDCKATNFKMLQDLSCFAVSGPTADQQPPFQWSKTEWKKPVGHPDIWKFGTELVNWNKIFK